MVKQFYYQAPMRCFVYILFSLFFPHISIYAQDTLPKYFTEALRPCAKEEAAYSGYAIHTQAGWEAHAFYPDGSRCMWSSYKDKKLEYREGSFELYHPNGKRMISGIFENNQQKGVWMSWYESGQLQDSGRMDKNKPEGNWVGYHPNGQRAYFQSHMLVAEQEKLLSKTVESIKNGEAADPAGLHLLTGNNSLLENTYQTWFENGNPKDSGFYKSGRKEGLWKSSYMNGLKESVGTYLNDLEEGDWHWYFSNGFPATIEKYRSGKLVDLYCFDSVTGKANGSSCNINRKPQLQGLISDERFVKENLFYPQEALQSKLEGNVKVKVFISSQGRMKEINIISSTDPMFSKEVIRMLKSMPGWDPAISHNRAVDYWMDYDFPFALPDEARKN